MGLYCFSSYFHIILVIKFTTQFGLLGVTSCSTNSSTSMTPRRYVQPQAYHDNTSLVVNTSIKMTLYFLVMAPYPDSPPFNPSWEGGPAVVPGAMVAKDYVNNRSDILNNYTIEFLPVLDSGCNVVSKAVNSATHSLFYSGKNVVGIIGPGCSEATLAIAPLVTNSRTSLIQIAPTATSPLLTNSTLYPNTFRPIVSALGFVNTFVDLILQMEYQRVGALYEAERAYHTAVYTRFETAIQEAGKHVSSFGLFNTSIPISEFLYKTRVIFVFASIDFARTILCLAINQGMLYPDYQLIFSNRRPNNFMTNVTFNLDGTYYSCTPEEMERAMVGMVFCNFRLTRQDRDSITDAGISYNQFSKKYEETRDCHLKSLGLKSVIDTEHHSSYFDATWALALSLNNSLPRLEKRGLSLSNYTYQMPEVTQIVREELLKLDFEGMRGRVQFSKETLDGANVTVIDMYQASDIGSSGIIGFYDLLLAKPLTLYGNGSLLTQAIFNQIYITPHLSLGIVVIILTTVLFLVLLACHVANVVWGHYKTVKATSPKLNHLIFSGCYLSLVEAILYTNVIVFIDEYSSVKRHSMEPMSQSLICIKHRTLAVVGLLDSMIFYLPNH